VNNYLNKSSIKCKFCYIKSRSDDRQSMMDKRPGTVTFIAWFSIVVNIFALLSTVWVANNFMTKIAMDFTLSRDPIPLQIHYGLIYFNIFSSIGCGIGMLMGHNWARSIYTCLSIFWMAMGFLLPSSQSQAVPTAIVMSISLFLLYLPNANRYFTQSSL
jgi:hypothetical protein